jgi:hypothetical protein
MAGSIPGMAKKNTKIVLSDETLNGGPVYECLITWHARKPGETFGIGASFCIFCFSPKSKKMTNIL